MKAYEIKIKEYEGKKVLEKIARDEFFIASLKREIEAYNILQGLKNIPMPIYTKISEKEVIFIREYIEGETLGEYAMKNIKNGSWKNERKEIEQKIIELLIEMHRKGVVFPDLHEENIIIDKEKNIYLVDLGGIKIKDEIPLQEFI
ncbi:hypothetical protein J7K74_04135, partial [Candidatus Woesearchaeota archaeon]|nr:hypothetical protein [Candidatus Woesearchaeota archaeon]